MSVFAALGERGERFLFASGSAHELGVGRVLFYLWYLVQVGVYDPAAYARLPPSLWRPVLLLQPFPPPDNPEAIATATWLLRLVLLMSAVGLFTRPATVVAAILGTALMAIVNSYGEAANYLSPIIIISWVLAFAPAGDAVSIDAWRRRIPVAAPLGYGWPIALARLTLVALMLSAGLHKVAGGWLFHPGESIAEFLRLKFYVHAQLKGAPISEVFLTISRHEWLCACLGVATVALETGSILALRSGRPLLRGALIGGLFAVQLVLAVGLQTFASFPWLAAYFFWVPWERLVPRSESRAALKPTENRRQS